jgi:hypothetical protein
MAEGLDSFLKYTHIIIADVIHVRHVVARSLSPVCTPTWLMRSLFFMFLHSQRAKWRKYFTDFTNTQTKLDIIKTPYYWHALGNSILNTFLIHICSQMSVK